MRRIYFFCLLLFPAAIHSQVPGFLGRKFYIQGGANLNIAFTNPIDYQQFEDSPPYGVNTRWEGSFNYVTGYHTSVGLSFQYLRTAFEIPTNTNYWGDAQYAPFGDVKAYYFGANIKKFFGNNLAPVGPYIKIEFGAAYLYTDLWERNQHHVKMTLETATPYAFIYVGRQHIFFKRLMLDYGFQIGATGLESLFSWGGSNTYSNEEAVLFMKRRLLQHTMFNFYAGLGVVF